MKLPALPSREHCGSELFCSRPAIVARAAVILEVVSLSEESRFSRACHDGARGEMAIPGLEHGPLRWLAGRCRVRRDSFGARATSCPSPLRCRKGVRSMPHVSVVAVCCTFMLDYYRVDGRCPAVARTTPYGLFGGNRTRACAQSSSPTQAWRRQDLRCDMPKAARSRARSFAAMQALASRHRRASRCVEGPR